jgi:hypothetical protein
VSHTLYTKFKRKNATATGILVHRILINFLSVVTLFTSHLHLQPALEFILSLSHRKLSIKCKTKNRKPTVTKLKKNACTVRGTTQQLKQNSLQKVGSDPKTSKVVVFSVNNLTSFTVWECT